MNIFAKLVLSLSMLSLTVACNNPKPPEAATTSAVPETAAPATNGVVDTSVATNAVMATNAIVEQPVATPTNGILSNEIDPRGVPDRR